MYMNNSIKYLVSLCALMLLIPLHAVPNWSAPANVSLVTGQLQQVCCDPEGNPIAVWLQSIGDLYAVYGSTYTNGQWKMPEQISNPFTLYTNPSIQLVGPQLCCDAPGHAIVLWVAADIYGKNPVLYATGYTPGNQSPTNGDQVSIDATAIGGYPELCCDQKGHAILAWVQGDEDGNPVLYGAGYTPQINQVMSNLISYDANFEVFSFALCCDKPGHAIIVWANLVNPNTDGSTIIYDTGYKPGDVPVIDTIYTVPSPNPLLLSVSYPVICCDAPGMQ